MTKNLTTIILVNKSTFFPKKKTKIEINKAWVKALLNEKTIPSKGWVLKTVIGVNVVAEWCTLWKAHKIENLCMHLWTKYFVKSSTINNIKVNNEIIIYIGVSLNIPALSQGMLWKK